jgi:hypothetical protein
VNAESGEPDPEIVRPINYSTKFKLQIPIFRRASLFENEMMNPVCLSPPLKKAKCGLKANTKRNTVWIAGKHIHLQLCLIYDCSKDDEFGPAH